MPEQPRLEADGLPSVDFAIRSPNVEDTSSEDGSVHADHVTDEPLRGTGGAPSGYVDEIQFTEMDVPSSPPEKSRGVPGSPPPLETEVHGRARNDSAPLHAMPSPVRRRSLSPQGAERPEARESRPDSRRRTRDFIDDSIMGASPRTEESLDSLASFFADGHYHVSMRVPAEDEPLLEPPQQQRDCHSSREEEPHHVHCCQHGIPCTSFFPSPVAPAGPGGSIGPGCYVQETSEEREPAAPSSQELRAGSQEFRPSSQEFRPSSQELRAPELRAGIPRMPAPTAHQPAAELPSGTLPESPRNLAAPSRAPVFEVPQRATPAPPEIPQAPVPPPFVSHQGAYTDASSQGAVPAPDPPSTARPRPAAPAPEADHSAGLQSAGPMPAEAECAGRFGPEMRTEGQAFPAGSGYRPPASFANPMVAGFAPQNRSFSGAPHPAPYTSHGGIPFHTSQSFAPRVPPFQQDVSAAMPAVHPSVLGMAHGQASQGPISAPPLAPGHMPSMAMPWPSPSPQIPPPQHGLPMQGQMSFPAPAHLGGVPGNAGGTGYTGNAVGAGFGANDSGTPMQAREGVRTAGRMPMEADSPSRAGQGPSATELGSGTGAAPVPSAPAATAAPAASAPPAAPAPAALAHPSVGTATAGAVLRTEAAMPEQRPSASHAKPPSTVQASQTEGRLPPPPAEREPADQRSQEQLASQNLSQGQLFSQHEDGSPIDDLHHEEATGSPPQLSPLAPSLPDVNSAEEASRQLETPPHIETVNQGMQTTPEKKPQRKKRAQDEPIRLRRDAECKLVRVDLDGIPSCNQAGRPKRKQMRVLEGWRNERVVYERTPGSACPTVCGVMMAQPKDQEAIPLQLNLEDPKAWSPVPSNNSDSTFQYSQTEEEKIVREANAWDATEKSKRKTRSNRSQLRRVEEAAEMASAAAAATFEVATPPRARQSHTTSGFVRVPVAEGSADACEIKVGLDNGKWMSCDIKIPPLSFNTPEELAPNRSLLIFVMYCEDGKFCADLSGDKVILATGSAMVVKEGQAYCLRNESEEQGAHLKMVLINSQRSG